MKEIKYPEHPERLFLDKQYEKDDTYLRIRVVCYWIVAITTFLLFLYLKMREVC